MIENYALVSTVKLQITANKMQRFLNLFIFTFALHVSGGSCAHHQEQHNCTYSFRYCQTILLLAATVEEMELAAVSVDNT
jgi:hypothetical protein